MFARFWNVKCSVTNMLHVFLVPYDKYEGILHVLVFWNVFILSQKFIYPQYPSSYLWSSPVLSVHVHTLNVIIICHSHICKHNHPVIFFLSRCAQSILLYLNIICTQNFLFFIPFLIAYICCVDDFQLLTLDCFVDVSFFLLTSDWTLFQLSQTGALVIIGLVICLVRNK